MRRRTGGKIKKNPAVAFYLTAGLFIHFFFPKVSKAFPQDYALKLTLNKLLTDDLQHIIICYKIFFAEVFFLLCFRKS